MPNINQPTLRTEASVRGFQSWGGVMVDGVVGDRTWSVSLHTVSATLESVVGLVGCFDHSTERPAWRGDTSCDRPQPVAG